MSKNANLDKSTDEFDRKRNHIESTPASFPSMRIVIDLAADVRTYDFQNFQSIASICLTTDPFP